MGFRQIIRREKCLNVSQKWSKALPLFAGIAKALPTTVRSKAIYLQILQMALQSGEKHYISDYISVYCQREFIYQD